MEKHSAWWQEAIIYQVYPRSFMDFDGDGIGDLKGLESRLDYLEWLGIEAVWLSPIYPSPMADFGYDVSSYVDIHPMFGTLADFDSLLHAVHRRGMRLIMDFVPNHTSEAHPWFIASRSSRDNPKRDWYIWLDPAPDGGPPNNWLSNFGGTAWEYDQTTGQYYYHAFLPQQPDLNWRNPEVQAAMLDAMRFWLDRGVDGFRVDVIWHLIKDEEFRGNPPDPNWHPDMGPHRQLLQVYTTDRPEVHDVIEKMRRLLDEYEDRMMVGEIYLPVERLVTYYGTDGRSGVHLPFNFQLILLPWDASAICHAVDHYEAALPRDGWPNWVLGNHDNHRIASRVGGAQARVAAMLLLTLRGTPTMYYGDEIGMHDVPIPPDSVHDPFEKNVPGLGLGRDPERTPMQWDAGRNAGFTVGTPWLPISEDYRLVNAEVARDDPHSILNLYRRLLELRSHESALKVGSYRSVHAPEDVFAYLREDRGRRFLIALNFSGEPRKLAGGDVAAGEIVLSTSLDREGERLHGAVEMAPNQGLIVRLTQ